MGEGGKRRRAISLKQRRGLDVNLYEAPARDFSTGVMGMVLAGEGM